MTDHHTSNGCWSNNLPLGQGVRSVGERLTASGIHAAYIGKWNTAKATATAASKAISRTRARTTTRTYVSGELSLLW